MFNYIIVNCEREIYIYCRYKYNYWNVIRLIGVSYTLYLFIFIQRYNNCDYYIIIL